MRLTGVYFDLTDRFVSRTDDQRRLVDQRPLSGVVQADAVSATASPKVLISVAKRLVPSAVRRNTVKRIVREAWRAAIRNAASVEAPPQQTPLQQTISASARPGSESVQGSDRPGPGSSAGMSPRVCLVRLKRFPGTDLRSAGRKARGGKAGTVKFKAGNASAENVNPGDARLDRAEAGRKPAAAVIRRGLRNDVDDLFAAFLSPGQSIRSRRSMQVADDRSTSSSRAR